MRVKTEGTFERWGEDERGHATFSELRVEAVADVDLDAETVALVECHPDRSELTDVELEQVENDLFAEALSIRRQGEARAASEKRSAVIASEIRELAYDIARLAAVADRGPEADLGLAYAVQEAAS